MLGNIVNYSIGRAIGPPAFSGRYRLLKVEYLQRTEEFFARHGGMAIFLSRFMPIIRTCAPFVAGVGRMPYARFLAYNLAGGFAWVLLFIWGGYLFGNIPLVKTALRARHARHHRPFAAAARRLAAPPGRLLKRHTSARAAFQRSAMARIVPMMAADQQRDIRDRAQHEAEVAGCRRAHVAAEVDRPPDDEQRAERCGDVGVHVAREQQDRRHEDDQLLERVHLHAEVALEHLVAGGGGGGTL